MTHSGKATPRLAAVTGSTSPDPALLLPLTIRADDSDTPADMLDALALAPFTAGGRTGPPAGYPPRRGRRSGLTTRRPPHDDTPPWRLLLLEDCDELIGGQAGQPLSRLLNLTDGMLGQGRKVLVAITTNEDLHQLHPAVVRPGRCLAHIEIGPLAAGQNGVCSSQWVSSA